MMLIAICAAVCIGVPPAPMAPTPLMLDSASLRAPGDVPRDRRPSDVPVSPPVDTPRCQQVSYSSYVLCDIVPVADAGTLHIPQHNIAAQHNMSEVCL